LDRTSEPGLLSGAGISIHTDTREASRTFSACHDVSVLPRTNNATEYFNENRL
jgi:hypothetical protein